MDTVYWPFKTASRCEIIWKCPMYIHNLALLLWAYIGTFQAELDQ